MISKGLYDREQHILISLLVNNGMAESKNITGIRGSGKSTLLFEIYREYLLNTGVDESEIIAIALDDDINEMFRNPAVISDYVSDSCLSFELI